MSNRKKLKDLTIRDNFMFAAVMMQGDNCKHFLEMVLGIEIARIELSYEKNIIYNPECKGVRFDVYAEDENNTRYDVEMQVIKKDLRKRSRYYHSQMDMELLASGHDYEELPKEMELFLKFVREDSAGTDRKFEGSFTKQVQETINDVKKNRELENRHMLLEEALSDERIITKRMDILELLEDYGEVSGKLYDRIMSESNADTLRAMHKAAAKANSLEQFEELITNL